MIAPLHLVTDDEREIAANATNASLPEQLLCTAVLTLMNDVRELKRQVKELSHCMSA